MVDVLLHMHQMAAMQRGARQGSPPGGPRGYDETIESCQPHACRQTRHIGYDEDLSPSSLYKYLYRANRQAGRQALISGTTRKADAETLKHETRNSSKARRGEIH